MRWPLLLPTTMLLLAAPATALPLHAVLSGEASGSLGVFSFTDAAIVIEISADTDDVGPPAVPAPGVLVVSALQALVHVDGVGTATVTESTLLGYNDAFDVPFFRSSELTDPGGSPRPDFFQLLCGPTCEGWELDTSIGPVTGPALLVTSSDVLATDLGDLQLDAFAPGSAYEFEATVVPEPSTALLLAGGLAALAARRRA